MEEGRLLPSCTTFGVSTSGGGPTLPTSVVLNSSEAGVEDPSAGIIRLSVTGTDGVSGLSKPVLEDAAPSENLSTFLFLIEFGCLFGVSECCTLEAVLLIWHDPCGCFPGSDTTADSVALFVRVLFG